MVTKETQKVLGQTLTAPESTAVVRSSAANDDCHHCAGLWSRSRRLSLEKNCQRLGLGRLTSRSRSRPFSSRVQDHALTVS